MQLCNGDDCWGWGEILNYVWYCYCCSSISQVSFGEAVWQCVIESYYGHSCEGTIYAQICKKMASQYILTLLKQKLFSFTSFLPLTDHLSVLHCVTVLYILFSLFIISKFSAMEGKYINIHCFVSPKPSLMFLFVQGDGGGPLSWPGLSNT